MLKVFAVGSCRVMRPLRRQHELSAVEFLNIEAPRWSLHAAQAGRQFVEVALGKKEWPAAVADLIVEGAPRRQTFDGASMLASTDVVVVEVSSLKTNLLDGWVLNQNLMRHARGAGDPRLARVESWVASEREVHDELDAIRQLAGKPIVLMDHLYFLDKAGEQIGDRAAISSILANYATKAGVPFMSTQAVIAPHGQALALQDKDHFKAEFEPVAGAWLLEGIGRAAGTAGA